MAMSPDIPPRSPDPVARALAFSFKRMGEVRDSLLVASFFTYIFGYVSWVLFASIYDYGLLSVLDAEYLTAGIIPATICVGAYVSWHWLYRFGVSIPSPRRRKIAAVLAIVGTLSFSVVVLVRLFEFVHGGFDSNFGSALFVLGCMPILLAVFFEGAESSFPFRRVAITFVSLGPIAVALGLWWIYIFVVFPVMPAAIGGPNHCVQIDIDTSKISRETLEYLVRVTPTSETHAVSLPPHLPNIYGVDRLTLVFEGRDYFLVAGSFNGRLPLHSAWVRLQTKTVSAIKKCTPST